MNPPGLSTAALASDMTCARWAGVVATTVALLFALSDAAIAQQPEREQMLDALRALAGDGGVHVLQAADVRDTLSHWFPRVRFFVATAQLEHGGTFDVVAGADSAGRVFLLDGVTAFRWLLRTNPVAEIPADSAFGYALTVARLTGLMDSRLHAWPDRPPTAEMPGRQPSRPSIRTDGPAAFVDFDALSDQGVRWSFSIVFDRRSGMPRGLSRRCVDQCPGSD